MKGLVCVTPYASVTCRSTTGKSVSRNWSPLLWIPIPVQAQAQPDPRHNAGIAHSSHRFRTPYRRPSGWEEGPVRKGPPKLFSMHRNRIDEPAPGSRKQSAERCFRHYRFLIIGFGTRASFMTIESGIRIRGIGNDVSARRGANLYFFCSDFALLGEWHLCHPRG